MQAADPGRVQSIDALAERAASCEGCDLYRSATQVVFGDGPTPAALMLMGEQPGDREDLEGAPFVGPAGRVLDRALAAAGQSRDEVYVTNVVKHFKWTRAGKVRLHKKPNAAEVRACRPWWEAELAIVQPRVLCCLGATAAQAVFGRQFRVTRDGGHVLEIRDGLRGLGTIHPSAVLRADPSDREQAFEGLVRDLELAGKAAAS